MQLNVNQAFTLVATSDVAGRPLGPQRLVCLGVAGAVLTDLALARRIVVDPQRGDRIRVESTEPLGDALLDGVLSILDRSAVQLGVGTWLKHLGTKRLRDDVLTTLVEREVLVRDPRRTLGVGPARRCSANGARAYDELIDAMRRALSGQFDPTAACVIVLCDCARVLTKVVDDVPQDVLDRIALSPGRSEVTAEVARVMHALGAHRASFARNQPLILPDGLDRPRGRAGVSLPSPRRPSPPETAS